MPSPDATLALPHAYAPLLQPARYKCFYGGRASAKSWSVARFLIAIAYTRKVRVLCAREFQSSMAESVLRLLADQIEMFGLTPWFDVQNTTVVCRTTGSEFIFKGLRRNTQELKSLEAVDYCWVEEAQSVSAESWQVLIPTIRKAGSEIIITFNPDQAGDPTYQRFVVNPPPGAVVVKTSWRDNPDFSTEADAERRYMLRTDPDAYEWIWGGSVRTISDAIVFKGRFVIEPFETPPDARFFHGADWGFAVDPTVLVRCFIDPDTNALHIDQEAYGIGVELDALPALFDRIPTARTWPIHADNSRPETISYVRRQGFQIRAADKWPGCVEDGIAHLKGFSRIVIHERCEHMAQEARLYSYKKDAKSGDVLPILVDKHDHCWDATRYSLDGYIRSKSGAGLWAALAD